MSHTVEFLKGKSILITGATGFIGKALVFKLLYEAPQLKQLYILVRNLESVDYLSRLKNEIVNHVAFQRLRDKHGDKYESFMADKLTAVCGNLIFENAGIDRNVRQQLIDELDIIVHAAADVKFDETIDESIRINALGTEIMVQLAISCRKQPLFIYVSSAYVSGKYGGYVTEKPLVPGLSAKDMKKNIPASFNVRDEIQLGLQSRALVTDRLQVKLRQRTRPSYLRHRIQRELQQLGTQRASDLGWQDTYTYTKALGEMAVMSAANERIPVVIVRPSIVESGMQDPEPGWVEGMKVLDPLIASFVKGSLPLLFYIKNNHVFDIVPVDRVVNTIILAMPRRHGQLSTTVYQVATSAISPLRYQMIITMGQRACKEDTQLRTMTNNVSPPPPLRVPRRVFQFLVISAVWIVCVGLMFYSMISFSPRRRRWCAKFQYRLAQQAKTGVYLSEMFKPYTSIDWIFDSSNTLELYQSANAEDRRLFSCDLNIPWQQYTILHLRGLLRYEIHPREARHDAELRAHARQGGLYNVSVAGIYGAATGIYDGARQR